MSSFFEVVSTGLVLIMMMILLVKCNYIAPSKIVACLYLPNAVVQIYVLCIA